jgi:hypothetical protein
VRKLAGELQKQGVRVGYQTVATRLRELGYTLQANRKCIAEGSGHPDRNEQFDYINRQAQKALRQGYPLLSVDTKKKELVGNFKNDGKEWSAKRNPVKITEYDFPGPDIPHAHPYGIYDVKRNEGFVNVGSDHDTGQFAVASIRAWWRKVGKKLYGGARQIRIMADSGGSNGIRPRLWKLELQKLADQTGLTIGVCHFPPGTSKWNKVEHRLFSFISLNWRAKPLISFETIVKLICSTRTSTGLKVYCQLDQNDYPTHIKVTDEQMKSIKLIPASFHGEWNYTIKPHKKKYV